MVVHPKSNQCRDQNMSCQQSVKTGEKVTDVMITERRLTAVKLMMVVY